MTYAGINLTRVAITAYLRAYEPPRAFSDEEADRWLSQDSPRRGSEDAQRWLLLSGLPSEEVTARNETAIVIKGGEGVLICPRRTRLRMLAGLLAFRNSVPEEVAEAFVPEEEARRAARELAEWVEGIDDEGMLELDYGSVASMFEADDLVEDRCASLVWQ